MFVFSPQRSVNSNAVWHRFLHRNGSLWPALSSNPELFKVLGFTDDPPFTASSDCSLSSTINAYKTLYHVLRPLRSLVPPPPPSTSISSEQLLKQQQVTSAAAGAGDGVWARVTRVTRSLAGSLNRALGRTQLDEPRCRVAMLGPGLNGSGDQVVERLMFDARKHFELVSLLSGSRLGAGGGSQGSFGTGFALSLRHPLSNAWRPTAATGALSSGASAASEDELVKVLQEPLTTDGDGNGVENNRLGTFHFDLMVFFTNTYAERRRLAAATSANDETAAALPVNKLVASKLAAAETRLPEIAIQCTCESSHPLRDLCLKYLSGEHNVEHETPTQVELAPQLERILRAGCDALVYTVDPALLATASAAAEARAELWAVLRAAMPDVYSAESVTEPQSTSSTTSTATSTSSSAPVPAMVAGRKPPSVFKPLLVLSLSAAETSSDADLGVSSAAHASTSSGVQPGVGASVLQLARLLDMAHVRTPWALVQCRVPSPDNEARGPYARKRVRTFEFESVSAGGHRDGCSARCYREHALAPLDRAFAWLARATSCDADKATSERG